MDNDIIRSQVDGRPEWNPHDFNEQNRTWAANLANVALADPQDLSKGERLPTDVLAVVAELLAGDRNLHTLARLNVAGRHIHDCSLPVLYETLIIVNEQVLKRLVRYTNPKGWKFVKFLFVSKRTLPLLDLYLRTQTQELSLSTHDLFASYFPRLQLLGSTDATSPDSLRLTLYKPIQLASLLHACMPHGSHQDACGITFFGTHYLRQNMVEGLIPKPYRFCNIVELIVRNGAFIAQEAATEMEGWHTTYSGVNFRLDISDDIGAPGVEDTLRIVMDHLTLYASKEVTLRKHIRLKVKCTPRVLEKIIELFEARPCFLNLEIDLTAPVTKEDMKRYLLALGSAYSQHWPVHARNPASHQLFLEVQAPAPALEPSWWDEYHLDTDPEAEHMWMQWHGSGMYGHNGADFDEDDPADNMENVVFAILPPEALGRPRVDERSGFVLTLSRALMLKSEHQDGIEFWSRSYQVAAPPPAVPTNGQQAVEWDEDAPLLSEIQLRALLLAGLQAAERARMETADSESGTESEGEGRAER